VLRVDQVYMWTARQCMRLNHLQARLPSAQRDEPTSGTSLLETQWASTSAAASRCHAHQALMHAGCMHGKAGTRPASRYFSPQSQRPSYISIKSSQLIGPDGLVIVVHRSRISHDNVCAAEYHTCTTSLSRSLAAGCPRVVPISAALLARAVPPPSACQTR
jgi:hypothetical protein